jgi:hypothetical protein
MVPPDVIVERPHGVKLSQLFVSLSSVYVAVLNDSVLMLGIIIVPLENESFCLGLGMIYIFYQVICICTTVYLGVGVTVCTMIRNGSPKIYEVC